MQCITSTKKFSQDKKTPKEVAHWFYSLSFGCFALMNMSAIFAHCLFPPAIYTTGLADSYSGVRIAIPVATDFYTTVTHIAHVIGE
jgi:hypothetical protein